jgi:acetylxylan esterase
MARKRHRKTSARKRIGLAGTVAVVAVGAMFVVQNSFAATIPGLGRGHQVAAGFGATTRVASTGDSKGNCPDAHIIVTRASTEAPGEGIIGSLATAVTRASKQKITVEATDYPAAISPYPPSVAAGTKALTTELTTEATNCPTTKIVMMGYSQGAHVIGDVLAGTGRVAGFTPFPAVSATVSDKVTAVILMGDPRYVPGTSFNAGTSKTKGLFPRGNDASLDAFAARTQSYCDTGDTFCASGSSIAVHLGYTRKYNSEAQAFVLDRIGG